MDCADGCIPMNTTAMNTFDNTQGKSGKYRMPAPRVDMTPMVDLGFLLITFFIFTTSISQPNAMKLAMPKDDGDPTPVKCSVSLTLVPLSADSVGWFDCQGGQSNPIRYASLSGSCGIREILVRKQKELALHSGSSRDLMVMISPKPSCDYATLVNLLDEITINGVTRYAIVE